MTNLNHIPSGPGATPYVIFACLRQCCGTFLSELPIGNRPRKTQELEIPSGPFVSNMSPLVMASDTFAIIPAVWEEPPLNFPKAIDAMSMPYFPGPGISCLSLLCSCPPCTVIRDQCRCEVSVLSLSLSGWILDATTETGNPKSSGQRVYSVCFITYIHNEHLEGPRKILLSGYKLCFFFNWGSHRGPREQSLGKVSQEKKSEKRRWGQDSLGGDEAHTFYRFLAGGKCKCLGVGWSKWKELKRSWQKREAFDPDSEEENTRLYLCLRISYVYIVSAWENDLSPQGHVNRQEDTSIKYTFHTGFV